MNASGVATIRAVACLLVLAAIGVFAPARAANPPGVPLQLAKFNGTGKDQCLQTTRLPNFYNNRLAQAQCTPMGGQQMYSFFPVAGGGYTIRNTVTGFCLDVEWGANWGGGRVLDWPCNGQGNQRWEVDYRTGLPSVAKIRGWQSKLCLDFKDGIAVQMPCGSWGEWRNFDGPIWILSRQDYRLPYKRVALKSERNGLCMNFGNKMDLQECGKALRTDIKVSKLASDGGTFQLWMNQPDECLVDTGLGFARLNRCPNNNSAAWRLLQVLDWYAYIPPGANRWEIQNVASGSCLDGGDPTLVQMRQCSWVPNRGMPTFWSFVEQH